MPLTYSNYNVELVTVPDEGRANAYSSSTIPAAVPHLFDNLLQNKAF